MIPVAVLGIMLHAKCTQVLWGTYFLYPVCYWHRTHCLPESVLAIPPHGIQLETHRGLPSYPLFASRQFIPSDRLRNLVINEGLRGWDVRYYLVAIQEAQSDVLELNVAFEVCNLAQYSLCSCFFPKLNYTILQSLLPRFPVLIEIYRGIHGVLHTGLDTPPESESSYP